MTRRRSLLTFIVAVALVVVGAGAAGPPGNWTRITDTNDRNIDQAATARTADGVLHVIWTHTVGPNREDLMHTRIGANGQPIGQPNAVQSGWATIGNPDLIVTPGGGLRAFWGGIRSTASGETNNALNTATAGADGLAWSLQSGKAARDTSAYASTAGAGLAGSTPVSAWATTFGTRVHFGTSPADVDIAVQDGVGNCCGYQPDIATDSNGQAYVGWYSNADNQAGVYVQGVSPGSVVGGKLYVPGSATADKNRALSLDQRVGITARVGGGVYVASGAGYPTFATVNLWRVGAAGPSFAIPARGAQDVNIAAAPEGRLWLMWHRSGRVYAVRTNKAATRVGPVTAVTPPSGTSTIWKVAGDGALGPLDVLTSVTTSGGALSTWHTQVLPRLQLRVIGGKKKATFVVTDAGDPVAGATVRAGGKRLTTNAAGKASAAFKAGKVGAAASKAGYSGASASTRVKK
jgi:hypothetical protein